MYKVVTDEDEIEKYQEKLKKILRNEKETEKFESQPIGTPNGSRKVDKYWFSRFEFWSAYHKRDKKTEGFRHVNLFGLTKPEGNKSATTIHTVELNFPLKDINKKLQGIFAKDEEKDNKDKVIVAHRGYIQINLREKKRQSLHLSKNCEVLEDDGHPTGVKLVGELDSPEFLKDLSNFIKEVGELKKNARDKQNEEVEIGDDSKKQNIQQKNNDNTTNTKQNKRVKNYETDESIKKVKTPENNRKNEKNDMSSYIIAQKVKEIIIEINNIRELNEKRHIFDQAALFKIWDNIGNSTKSKNDFKNFSENLYKLLREKTRYNNPNKKNKDDPKYIYLLPNNFVKIGTTTRHFWDIVNTLRHYYIHDEKGKITDVYEELLGKDKRSGPETPDEYMKLQIEILNLFENSMENLLEMVKNH